jgi:hypothetical protein
MASPSILSYRTTTKSNSYYSVPVSGYIIDYNLTPVPPKPSPGLIDRLFGGVPPLARTNRMAAFDELSKVKFGYGLAKGGDHTLLLSYGMIFEVHWDKIGEDLFERSSLYTYPWLDGLFVLPVDSGFSLP